jgi:ABC-type branched-subunit amino acid transport system substrate-binding protein
MVGSGHADLPLVSWDAIVDGSGEVTGSYIQLTGAAAVGSYAGHGSLPTARFDFADQYRREYSASPDEYAAAGYACVELIAAAIAAAAPASTSPAALREGVRAFAVDTKEVHPTVLGGLAFDANGDSVQQFVAFFRVEQSAANGTGDWVFTKQQDFGPAPP